MIPFHHVAGRFFNRPLLLSEPAALSISSVLLSRMSAARGGSSVNERAGESFEAFEPQRRADGSFEMHTPRTSRFVGEYPLSEDGRGRPEPFRRTPDGVAIITIVGELVNRGAWIGASSGLVSYEGIRHQLARAVADPKSTAIVLDLESPGGEAVGAVEIAAAVRKAAAVKPVVAVIDGMAASAGYAIASGASRIVTIPTGLAGSIGVVLMHLDYSEWLKNEGIEPTLVFAGAHKVDANPFEPLPPSVRDELQAEVTSFYGDFVAAVAAGRKAINAKAVRDTEARVFKGRDAVAAGLADAVGTLDDVLADLSRSSRGRQGARQQGGSRMSEHHDGVPGADTPGISKAAFDAAVATAHAAGRKVGMEAERERLKAILGLDAAKGKEAQALAIATGTDLSAEQATAVLTAGAPAAAGDGGLGNRLQTIVQETAIGGPGAAPPDAHGGWGKTLARINGKAR